MKVKETSNKGLNRGYEVVVPKSDIQTEEDAILQDYSKKVKVAGFRAGKVPMNIMRQRYGNAVKGDVLERVVNKSLQKVITDNKLKPAIQPKIEVKSFEDEGDLTFTVEVDIIPEFKVMDLAKIEIEKPVAKVPASRVDETLETLTKNNPELEDISEDRAAKKGDYVVMDFHGQLEDGTAHPGMQAHDYTIELGSGQLIPGFEDQLIGQKIGAHAHVNVTFPDNYGAKELAGQKAMFHCDIKGIKKATPVKIDDEFAKKIGFEKLDDLKAMIETQLGGEYKHMSRLKTKKALFDALEEGHKFELPSGMVDAEFENIMRQLDNERKQTKNEEPVSEDDKEEMRDIAERRVRLGLVLAEIGQAQNIQVSNQELQQVLFTEARKYPGREQQVFEFYQKNPQALESLRAPVFEEKVVDFILGKIKVTEVETDPDELLKEDDLEPKGEKAPKKKAAAKKKA
ncbi:MAG: trigger factor [Alphaproteobacteria bacterium]|nr:trigger factor [Alphaproteobacteria bacterium]